MLWKDEEVIKITEVADILWRKKIEAKIEELKDTHKDYKVTIKILSELLEEKE